MTRGGLRKNAKRPLLYGEPTKQIATSVPLSKIDQFKKEAKKILKKWKVKK